MGSLRCEDENHAQVERSGENEKKAQRTRALRQSITHRFHVLGSKGFVTTH